MVTLEIAGLKIARCRDTSNEILSVPALFFHVPVKAPYFALLPPYVIFGTCIESGNEAAFRDVTY